MFLPKIALATVLTAIGFISFTIPQNQSMAGHSPLAYLLPYVTQTPAKYETATLIPTNNPVSTSKITVRTLGYSVHVTSTPTPSTITSVPTAKPTTVGMQTPATSPTPQSVVTADAVQTFIMQALNDYRHTNGLGPVAINKYTCNFATTRAQEIMANFSHDGFTSRLNSHTLPYPNFSLVTENIAQTANYKDVVNMWANSSGHAANMRADTPYICVEYSGDYYAMEGWKPL